MGTSAKKRKSSSQAPSKRPIKSKRDPAVNPSKSDVAPRSDYKRKEIENMMIETVEKNLANPENLPYAALIQSSLTGKSRAVKEMASSIPTMYFCFGKKTEPEYPSQTQETKEFFQELEKKEKEVQIRIFENSMYLAVAKMSKFLVEYTGDVPPFQALWNAQVNGNLKIFSKDYVVQDMLRVEEREKNWNAFNDELKKNKDPRVSNLSVLLAFDEARETLKEVENHRGQSAETNCLFRVIRQSLWRFNRAQSQSKSGLYAFFIDSVSKVADFTPSDEYHSCEVCPPIFALDTMDIHLDDFPLDMNFSEDKLHYARMGRPGWLHCAGKTYSQQVKTVTRKLENSDDTTKLATLMCIFALEMRENKILAGTLCENHLAFLVYISPSRLTVEVRYLSEAPLVHAAHHILRSFKGQVFRFLLNFFSAGFIDVGERGEIVARILLLHCLTQKTPLNEVFGVQTNMMTTNDFFKRLGLKEACEEESELFNGKIHFSHWVRLTRWIKPQHLLLSYYRDAAIVCKKKQPSFDLVIPIFLDTKENRDRIKGLGKTPNTLTDEDLSEEEEAIIKSCFSFIAVQIKNFVHSRDTTTSNPEAYVQDVNNEIEKFSTMPGFVMYMEMSGVADDVVLKNLTERKHCFIKRTGLQHWDLSDDEKELAKDLLVDVETAETENQVLRSFRSNYTLPREIKNIYSETDPNVRV